MHGRAQDARQDQGRTDEYHQIGERPDQGVGLDEREQIVFAGGDVVHEASWRRSIPRTRATDCRSVPTSQPRRPSAAPTACVSLATISSSSPSLALYGGATITVSPAAPSTLPE